MPKPIEIKTTSRQSADVTPFELSASNTFRLLFKPLIVHHADHPEACVRGVLLAQRKGPHDEWIDVDSLPLNKLRKEDWVKHDLSTEEILKLRRALEHCYELYEKYGLRDAQYGLVPIDLTDRLNGLLSDEQTAQVLFSAHAAPLLKEALKWVAAQADPEALAQMLADMPLIAADQLNAALRIRQVNALLSEWEANQDNADEDFWHELFASNAWILGQVFARPYMLLKDKAYVGGKSMSNQRGQVADFLYRNSLTRNVAIVEIKTPVTPLLGAHYRPNVYPLSPGVTGAIAQVLRQRDHLQEERRSLQEDQDERFEVLSPHGVVIAGCLKRESFSSDQRKCFELFRAKSFQVEVITFDELFARIRSLLEVFSPAAHDDVIIEHEPASDDIPF